MKEKNVYKEGEDKNHYQDEKIHAITNNETHTEAMKNVTNYDHELPRSDDASKNEQ